MRLRMYLAMERGEASMAGRPEGDDAHIEQRGRARVTEPTVRRAVTLPATTRTIPVRGSRNDQTRRHNLSALLSAVHYEGELTRAHLTRDTGLNRSTIGGLVAELDQLGLVREDAVAETGMVGRPSLIVRPRSEVVALALHPDVDRLELTVVGIERSIAARKRTVLDGAPTPGEVVAWTAEAVTELMGDLPDHRVVGLAVAIPALVSTDGSTVARAPHLGWRDVPLGEALAEATGLPVGVGNDANLGLRAEWSFGAARGVDNVVYLNGSSSGIGGAALVGGQMLRGARGYGGEFGHMSLADSGETCSCGRVGCLETLVNVSRIARAAGVPRVDLESADLGLLERDRPELAAELDRAARALGLAIANLECAFDPELVLLGGFLRALHAARAERIETVVLANAFRPEADAIAIARTTLREDLLAYGAAERAFAPLLGDPAGTQLHVV